MKELPKTEKKSLRVTMPDSTVWDIPATTVAHSRAVHYAKLDSERGEGDYDALYRQEFKYTPGSDLELLDWIKNNMDWDDLQVNAVRVQHPANPDYVDMWSDAEVEVV